LRIFDYIAGFNLAQTFSLRGQADSLPYFNAQIIKLSVKLSAYITQNAQIIKLSVKLSAYITQRGVEAQTFCLRGQAVSLPYVTIGMW